MRASPEGTNGLGWIRLGSAGGRGPMAEAGEGRGGKRREGVGPIRAQLLEAAGAPAPRAPVLTEDIRWLLLFFFSWTGSYLGNCVREVVTALC